MRVLRRLRRLIAGLGVLVLQQRGKGGHGSELASLALRYDDAGPPFRARPPIGDWIDSASSPPRAISHEITEFGITPLR
jgi:hypothetical protein